MKTTTALLALMLTAAMTFSATAEDQIAGNTWRTEKVSGIEPKEGTSLTLEFTKTLKITYTLAGESQLWEYAYSVQDGQLTLEPLTSIGKPKTVTYDIKFDEGKLLLLVPKPKPVEEEVAEEPTEEGAEGEGETAAEEASEEGAAETEAEAEEAAEEAEEAEAVEEQDTRTPVWVLVKA